MARADGTLTPSSGQPSNGNEPTWYVPSQLTVDQNGLNLNCTYQPGVASGKNYACGEVTTSAANQFHFEPGQGQTWVFQMVAKLPPTTGEEDPAYWATDPAWTWEIDCPEFWGWHAGSGGKTWAASNGDGMGFPAVPRTNGGGSASGEADAFWAPGGLQLAPDAGFHTYTVEMAGTTFSSWIDGQLIKSGLTVGSVGSWAKLMGRLILQHSLRDPTTGNPSPWFTSGTRDFAVRSIAVYEAAADHGANTQNPGVAPGTTIG
jgi:hypothetical protein